VGAKKLQLIDSLQILYVKSKGKNQMKEKKSAMLQNLQNLY
jgi:hypothetical protein